MALIGGNPVDYGTPDYSIVGKVGQALALVVSTGLQLQQDNVEALEAATAAGNEALHGTGSEDTTTGEVLAVGTGLSCHLLNGAFWIGGRRYVLNELAGYAVVSLETAATAYLYLDTDGAVTGYASLQSPRPVGTCYLGTATTDADSCTAVDDTDADRVIGPAAVADDVTDLVAAVGLPYAESDDLSTRVTALEAGVSGTPTYARDIPWASGDPTTNEQNMDAKDAAAIAAHVAALHGDDTGEASEPVLPWNVEADNFARSLVKNTQLVDADYPEGLRNCLVIVPEKWGVTGSTSGALYDEVNSTWIPDGVPA